MNARAQSESIQRVRKAIHEQKHPKPPKLKLADVEVLLDCYDELQAQALSGFVSSAAVWRDPQADPAPEYVPVLVRLQDGQVRVGRKGVNYWAYAEFTHDSYTRNKYPPISQPNNPVVGWLPIFSQEGTPC